MEVSTKKILNIDMLNMYCIPTNKTAEKMFITKRILHIGPKNRILYIRAANYLEKRKKSAKFCSLPILGNCCGR